MQDLLTKLEKIDTLQSKISGATVSSAQEAKAGSPTKKLDDIKTDTEQILDKVEFMRSRMHGWTSATVSPQFMFEKIQYWMDHSEEIIGKILSVSRSSMFKTDDEVENLRRAVNWQFSDMLSKLGKSGNLGPRGQDVFNDFVNVYERGELTARTATEAAKNFMDKMFPSEREWETATTSGKPGKPIAGSVYDLKKFGFSGGSFSIGEQLGSLRMDVGLLRFILAEAASQSIEDLPGYVTDVTKQRTLTPEEAGGFAKDIKGPARPNKERAGSLWKILLEAKKGELLEFGGIKDLTNILLEMKYDTPWDKGVTFWDRADATDVDAAVAAGMVQIKGGNRQKAAGDLQLKRGIMKVLMEKGEMKIPDLVPLFQDLRREDFEPIVKERIAGIIGGPQEDILITKVRNLFGDFLQKETAEKWAHGYKLSFRETLNKAINEGKGKKDDEILNEFIEEYLRPEHIGYKRSGEQKQVESDVLGYSNLKTVFVVVERSANDYARIQQTGENIPLISIVPKPVPLAEADIEQYKKGAEGKGMENFVENLTSSLSYLIQSNIGSLGDTPYMQLFLSKLQEILTALDKIPKRS